MTIEKKYPVQIKIGDYILSRIDHAAYPVKHIEKETKDNKVYYKFFLLRTEEIIVCKATKRVKTLTDYSKKLHYNVYKLSRFLYPASTERHDWCIRSSQYHLKLLYFMYDKEI